MIHDVDDALRALVQRDALNGSRVELSFEAPTKEWAAQRNTPTVNLYLYDIREDLERREVQYERVRDADGRTVERRQPCRWLRLSYLVTAWTQLAQDEHRLLSALLACFLSREAVPADLLTGSLADEPLPVLVHIVQPSNGDRSIADVWSALGADLRPSLELVVIAPIDPRRVQAAGPPVLEELHLRASMRPEGPVEVLQPAQPDDGRPPGRPPPRRRRPT